MLDEESEGLSVVDPTITDPSFISSSSPSIPTGDSILPSLSESDDEPVASILYIPSGVLPKLARYINRLIEIRIPAKYLSSKNKEVQTRQLWGNNPYTDDSDAVAILQHTGNYILRPNPPSNTAGLSALFRVLPGFSHYESVENYGIRSRGWCQSYTRCSLKLVNAEFIEGNVNQSGKGKENGPQPAFISSLAANSKEVSSSTKSPKESKLIKMLIVEKAPVKNSGKSKRKNIPDFSIMNGSEFEPVWKYCLGLYGDKGMDVAEWTAGRFRKEVAYFHHEGIEYELAKEENTGTNGFDRYRWSQILPLNQLINAQEATITSALQAAAAPPAKRGRNSAASNANAAVSLSSLSIRSQVPMAARYVKIIEKDLDWEQLEWGPTSVRVKGKEYPITTLSFRAIASAPR
jgi:hypothetical protein